MNATIRILMIEDNPDDADLLQEMLEAFEHASFSIAHAERLKEAELILASEQYDVILLDLSLPDSFGLETVTRLLKHADQLPIIVLTGNDDQALALETVKLGAQDYLVKGQIEEQLLGRAIRYAIERKRIQVQLAESNEKLDRFAQIISHDLSEPLRMVTSYLRLIEDRYQGRLDDKADKYIGYAVDGASHMHKLLDRLREYSRLSSQQLRFERVNVGEVVTHVVQSLEVAILEREAIITCDSLPTIIADPVRLAQLFQNLLTNAIRFCQRTPHIHVSTTAQEDGWLFAVQDNGIGIEENQLERIFEIFRRLHRGKEYEGVGIGLATCKKIVEEHGGSIWAESSGDKGSTFYFTLPKTPPAFVTDLAHRSQVM